MMTPRLPADSWLALLLCLLVVGLPRVGLAAQDAPLASPRLALSGPLADPESPDSGATWKEPERYRAPLGLRLLTEVGAGLVTSAAGGLAGWGVGALVCGLAGVAPGSLGCLPYSLFGGVMGLVEGYAVGVWWGGEVVGGDGNLLLSMLGATLGSLVAIPLALGGAQLGPINPFPLPIAVGAHLGYELSQRPAPTSPAVSSRPGVQPVLAFSSRGALLGLGGRF
jgi:hypothetical protein